MKRGINIFSFCLSGESSAKLHFQVANFTLRIVVFAANDAHCRFKRQRSRDRRPGAFTSSLQIKEQRFSFQKRHESQVKLERWFQLQNLVHTNQKQVFIVILIDFSARSKTLDREVMKETILFLADFSINQVSLEIQSLGRSIAELQVGCIFV